MAWRGEDEVITRLWGPPIQARVFLLEDGTCRSSPKAGPPGKDHPHTPVQLGGEVRAGGDSQWHPDRSQPGVFFTRSFAPR